MPSLTRLLLPALLAGAMAGCGGGDDPRPGRPGPYAGAPVERDGLRLPARVQGDGVALALGGGFERRFWPGVNLGATLPGHHPGELAPTRRDYDRWLDGMSALGVRAVRVYTIQRPAFYEALAAHNRRHAAAPLYFIQGVWIPEQELVAAGDAYASAVTDGFDRELADAVAVVHGDARLPERPGHAGGRYGADVARWLLAWSPGVEWDPHAVQRTDRRHAGMAPFSGRYVTATRGATPMESWLAARLDHLATLEARRGWSRPLTFTNWLTTDPLEHPSEPTEKEDLVSVDAMHLRATGAWPGGFFASYHAYPYYPDFLRLEPGYRDARSAYAAYLRDLRAHHRGQAVMITEFGVPSGLGAAHRGPQGRDQDDHSEQEAAAMNAAMLGEIRAAGLAGGVLFEWTDEWFKRTWNTVDLALPGERRPLWHNVLTNEAQFGVVAVAPGKRPAATVDGRPGEWDRARVLHGGPRELRAMHDAAYLYLLVRRGDPGARLQIGLDVRPGANAGLPGRPGVAPAADVALTVGPGRRATLERAAWTDPTSILYGLVRDYVPVRREQLRRDSGAWVRPRLLLNRPLTVPGTGERRPVETIDLGRLRWGTADPRARDYDARVLAAGDGRTVELRIPWMLLGFADPSSKLVHDVRQDGTIGTRRAGPIRAWVAPAGAPAVAAGSYDWRGWDRVAWHERRKAGWTALRRAFAAAQR